MSSQIDLLDATAWFKDEIECLICRNVLSDPTSLNCSHKFCYQCIEKQAYNLAKDGKPRGKFSVRCPSCDSETLVEDAGSLSLLKTDISISALLESLQGLGLIKQGIRLNKDDGTNEAPRGEPDLLSPRETTCVTSADSLDIPSHVTSVESQESLASTSLMISESAELAATPLWESSAHVTKPAASDQRLRKSASEVFSKAGSLRSSGFQCKSPVAPNQVYLHSGSFDSDNISLLISSERNTATTKSVSGNDKPKLETSSPHQLSGNSSKNDPANVLMERRCRRHPCCHISIFCIECTLAICDMCGEEEHYGHEQGDLETEAELLRRQLGTVVKDATVAIRNVNKAQHALHCQGDKENAFANQLDLMEKQIEANSRAMIAQIEKDRGRLLAEVRRLRQALSFDQLNALENVMRTGKRIATTVRRRGDAVDVVNTSREICHKMQKATRICASGGAIDRIGDLSFQFSCKGAGDLRVGQVEETINWQLCTQIPIPFDKRGSMQGMASLRTDRLAVGYETGGIDIFSTLGTQDRPLYRIIEDVKLVDLASTLDDTLVVYPIYGEITEVTPDGKKRPTKFAAPSSTDHVSMSSSVDGRIFLGYAEHSEIHQFKMHGGNPLRSISLDQCKPQQIDVTPSGKVILKDRSGIKVLDPTSNVVKDIVRVTRNQFAYSTCDIYDNVYVAKVSGRDGTASIEKYTLDGSRLECVSECLDISRNSSGSHWIRIVSLSPSKLACCDGSMISIYERQPSVIELADALGLQ